MSGYIQNTDKILLVGSESSNAVILTTILTEQGYDVQVTKGKETALDIISAGSPDLVLFASNVTNTDNLTFIQQLTSSGIPVICVIPGTPPQVRSQVCAVEGADYIMTPIQKNEVLARIQTRLTISDMKRQLADWQSTPKQVEHQVIKDGLKKDRDLGSTILDIASTLIVVLDDQGRIVRFNQACERTTGYLQEEVMGQYVWDQLLIPEETEAVKTVFTKLQSGHYPSAFENFWVTRDGEHRRIDWSNTALLDDEGQVTYVISSGIDVTEYQQTDAALQKLSSDLDERVKELECLYAMSALVETPDITREKVLQGTVELVPKAYQYPEITCAQIILDDQMFSTENYHETQWQQTRDILLAGRKAGTIQVCYLGTVQNGTSPPFLDEEESLIDAITQRLGKIMERMQAQDALRYSEERYALAQKAANIGSWDWDILAGDLHWTAQIASMYGFDTGEFSVTLDAFLDAVHPKDRDNVIATLEACVQQKDGFSIDHRIVRPDGTIRWVSETGNVIPAKDGKAIRMFGIVQDITEHKLTHEQIQQQNVFLNSILESLTHPFYVVRTADYTVEMANSAAYMGKDSEHPTCYALFHRLSAPCAGLGNTCPIEEVKRTQKSAIVEHIHYDIDGNEINTEVRCYPLFDDEGNIVRVIEYCLDITQRKQAQKALEESEARWQSVTQNSPDIVIILDRNLNIQYVNRASPGLTIEELIGKPLWTFVSNKRKTEIKGLLEGVLKTGEPCSYNTEYRVPGGGTIYYDSRVAARTVDNQITGLTVNSRDITDRMLTEQRLRAANVLTDESRRAELARRREAERRRRIAENLADVLVALNSEQPLNQILDYIAVQAKQALENEAVVICQLQDKTNTLAIQVAQGLPAGSVTSVGKATDVAILKQAATLRQVVAMPDLTTTTISFLPDADSDHFEMPQVDLFRAMLAVPIIVKDRVYGGILLYYAQPRSFHDEEMALAAIYGEQVALAVENAQLREQVRRNAVTSERSRLARDLHDSVTQALFSASLVAEVLPQVWRRDPEEVWDGLEELRHLTRGALAEMRTLLLELRPTALVETKLEDLLVQLTEAITSRTQIPIELNASPSPILPREVHVTLYRVAQEALQNVVKHAEASQVTVSLHASPPVTFPQDSTWKGKVVLCVSDDGQGFDQKQLGPDQFGLDIMHERATSVGGHLTIESRPGHGTSVTFIWETS